MLGITGTGGSGKSSLTDELVRRFRVDQQDKLRIAVLAVDPTRRRGGGALLGDRIRMNSLDGDRVFFRSLATRGGHELPEHLDDVIAVLQGGRLRPGRSSRPPASARATPAIVPFVDASLYVMTPEFGARPQLEKIDMLDFADAVAINKFERRGAKDALRDVGRQLVRNREAFGKRPEDMPVFGTSAATFNDDGVTALYQHLRGLLAEHGLAGRRGHAAPRRRAALLRHRARSCRPTRVRYLAEITETVRGYHAETERLRRGRPPRAAPRARARASSRRGRGPTAGVDALLESARRRPARTRSPTRSTAGPPSSSPTPATSRSSSSATRRSHTTLTRESLSGNKIPRVSLPRFTDHGELVRFWRRENLPGYFPFTAGVFPFKRDGEDPARMFAGEGDPFRTNRRFKLLSADSAATRLSTAFDSVTLYGRDPDPRPDVYGKVGTSGVSVATLDDMKALYDGFDLVSPTTVGVDDDQRPGADGAGVLPQHRRSTSRSRPSRPGGTRAERARRTASGHALANVRGTVQADILKEDQGQNTCLFSTEFSLRMMADIQEWFIEQQVRNFYSVSISGYHIAEAGANPISQLAFTLANGFTYVEAYLARGHGHRRLRAQPVVLLLQRHGPGVLRARPRRPPDLGGRDAGEVRRQRALRRS